jgi:hypothetical protein
MMIKWYKEKGIFYTSKLVQKLDPMANALWIGSKCAWASMSITWMIMMELNVEISFTSPYMVEETFFKTKEL